MIPHYPSMYPKGERPSGKGRYLVYDTEAVGLLPAIRKGDLSSMHCILVKDDRTQEVFKFFDPYEMRDPDNREYIEADGTQDGYLWDGIMFLMEAEVHIIQNGVGYDFHAFEKVLPDEWRFNYMEARGKNAELVSIYPNKVMDTMVMSQVLNPERKLPPQAYALNAGNIGAHTIQAHGIRMGRHKPENEDWSKLTDHMLHRCEEDVHIGQDFYHYLMEEWREHLTRPNPRTGLSINTAYRCELQMALMVARQSKRGFRLNMPLALDRCKELDEQIDKTLEGFRPHMPLRIKKKKLSTPVNGHTHGSECSTQYSITKKLTPKQWCEHTGKLDGYTQKAWIAENPIEQDNSVGEYNSEVKKHFPECRGFITDHEDPLVAGAFTPVRFEEIPLGNRDAVKEILYSHGWRGVVYNEAEEALIDSGREDELKPWAGKIEEKSIEAWKERGNVPDWCLGIADWYILKARRTQILNRDDVDYFERTKEDTGKGTWPRQASKKNECRGLVAFAYNEDLGMTAQEYYAKMGEWPTDPDEEWRVPAEAFACATNTFRMRHKKVVNIPSRGLYPLRDLFIAAKGKKILGCDGAGLELRMLANFLADAIYQEVVLNGDIHTHNQNLAGLPKRDMAKTFIYAFLYGSGISNLAKVCNMTPEEMELRIERFKAELPALPNLIERITAQGEAYGYLLAVDGRRGRIRSRDGKLLVHTMLNVLLQMTGSLSMKYGACFAERQMEKEKVALDADGFVAWLANVHDEVQMEVNEDEVLETMYYIEKDEWKSEEKRQHIDDNGNIWSAPKIVAEDDEGFNVVRRYHRAGHILCEAFVKAGEFLKLRCPLAGEYMIGDSWAETH